SSISRPYLAKEEPRDGDDGLWSTFQIQVGTPGQTVRLLPGTSASAGSTIWVVIPPGCVDVNPTLANCENERGYLFQSNLSTSWTTQGLQNGVDGAIYSLNTFEESLLGKSGNGSYGYDIVNLGIPGAGLPSLDSQVVAGIWTDDFFLGSLGLSPVPFNFTNLNEPQPSMLSSLYHQSLVPSRSWAYTAGAHYKSPPVFGSLTLGGYDTTRFEPNNLSFALGADFSRDLLVSLQAVTYDTVGSSPLLASSIDVFIDSMVSELWLPVIVCEAFAQQFDLTWNEQGQLYMVTEDAHAALVKQNPTFVFQIGQAGGGGETVDIVLPFAAFDLILTAPIVGNDTRYFPLKQAQNSSQYTLGRMFLQEAYVVADYERHNFSVSQALFPDTSVASHLVAIDPLAVENGADAVQDAAQKNMLGAGAIAGIAVGCIAALAVVALVIFSWYKRRKIRHEVDDGTGRPTPDQEKAAQEVLGLPPEEAKPGIPEMSEQHPAPLELQSDESHWERHELGQESIAHELDGAGITVQEPKDKRFSWES
ncbi:acid protease, partial [Diplocarpon rosae]